MRLTIKGFEIRVSFIALAVISFLTVSNIYTGYALCFAAVIIHELGHLLCMLIFRIRVRGISVSLFDIKLLESDRYKTAFFKDVLITLSGPAVNLLVFIISVGFSGVFAYVNLFVGLFNALPASTLDGGQALYLVLSRFFKPKTSALIIDIITIIISVPLFFAGFYTLLKTSYNFSLLFIGLYLFTGVFIRKDKYL